jgi:hypothetical protein
MLTTVVCMFLRSLYDDPGFHIHADEIEEGDKGVKL